MEKPYSEVKRQHRPHRIRYQENNSHSQHNTTCVYHIVFTFQCNFRVIAFQYFPSHCINRWDLKSLSRRRVSVSQRRRRARSLLPPFLEPNAGELLCQVLWAGDRLTPRLNEDNEKVKIDLLVITRFPAASHTHWEDNFRWALLQVPLFSNQQASSQPDKKLTQIPAVESLERHVILQFSGLLITAVLALQPKTLEEVKWRMRRGGFNMLASWLEYLCWKKKLLSKS